jgi:TorA maturation chaperone TorD
MEQLPDPLAEELSPILLRGALCKALALAFAYPSPDVLELLCRQWRALSESPLAWPDGLNETFQEAKRQLHASDAETLGPEHIRLFGPAGRCSLHETSYGDAARLLGKSASLADISAFYLAFGLEPVAGDAHPEDHIGLELEFLSLLAVKEAYALSKGWDAQLAVTRQAQRSFLQDHLGTWIDAFNERLHLSDPHPFYDAVGESLHRFVRGELDRLQVSPAPSGPWIGDTEMGADTLECPLAARDMGPDPSLPGVSATSSSSVEGASGPSSNQHHAHADCNQTQEQIEPSKP